MSAVSLLAPEPLRAVSKPVSLPRAHVRRWVLIAAAVLLGVAFWKIYLLCFGSNFHVVIPGRIYRGGQLDADELKTLIKDYGIRTVINLRGCCNPFDWYLEEGAAVQDCGISQEDICFSAGRMPSANELARLVDVFDHTEYPVYLHCRRGSDRTGLAAAVALLLLPDKSFADARRQLSLAYGHFNIGRPGYLDEFLELYELALSRKQREHTPDFFREWLVSGYRGGWCSYEIEAFELGERTPPPIVSMLDDPPKGSFLETLKPGGNAGELIVYRVRFRNLGDRPWPFRASPTGGIHVGYLIHDDQGKEVARGKAGFLDREVPPGDAIDITLVIAPIDKPGRYRLLVDLIDEGHCWFYQTGTEPREEELIIRE